MTSRVAVVRSDYIDARQNLDQAIHLLDRRHLTSHSSVGIQMNLCGTHMPGTEAITRSVLLDTPLRYSQRRY